MSNRRRRALSATQRAAVKQRETCPDCDSDVKIRKGQVRVFHDDGCPTLARLRRAGLDGPSFAIVKGDGQSHTEFAEASLTIAAEAARLLGGVRLRLGPYHGLPPFEGDSR